VEFHSVSTSQVATKISLSSNACGLSSSYLLLEKDKGMGMGMGMDVQLVVNCIFIMQVNIM